jgi:hypothetical protein
MQFLKYPYPKMKPHIRMIFFVKLYSPKNEYILSFSLIFKHVRAIVLCLSDI